MNSNPTEEEPDERSLVKLYMDLTGTNESCARAVFMYVCPPNNKSDETSGALFDEKPEEAPTNGFPKVPPVRLIIIFTILVSLCLRGPVVVAADSRVGTNTFITQPLALADA